MSSEKSYTSPELSDINLDICERKFSISDMLFATPLKFFKLNPNAKSPRKEHEGDAGWDLFYCGDSSLKIRIGQTVVVPTGIALVVDQPFVAILKEKSGLATKGVSVHAGVVDSGYRGEVGVVMSFRDIQHVREDGDGYWYLDDDYFTIEPGQKIAQVMLVPVAMSKEVVELDELPNTARGDGGFGSTGKF
jgi:dUTP pyrophosphatase